MAQNPNNSQRNKDKAMVALSDSYHDFAKGTRCGISGFKDNIKLKGFPTIFKDEGGTTDDNGLTLEAAKGTHRSSYFYNSAINLVGVAKGDNVEATMMNYVNTHYSVVDLQNKFISENEFNPPDQPDTSGEMQIDNTVLMQAKVFEMMGMSKINDNIGIIYDQCAMKDVINKLTTDYVTLGTKSEKGHIFNINPICGRWDEAGKIQVKRIDVSINVEKEGHENISHVNIQHTRNIRFNLKSDLRMLAIASEGTPVPDNYVELFYGNGMIAAPGRDGVIPNANIFYLRMLTKNPFNFSVANLCEAYSAVQLPQRTMKDAMEDAMDVVLNENKLSLFAPDKSLKSKLTNFFDTQGVFKPDQMNFLNIKRSADYGQIYLVQKLNDVGSDKIEMYAYNFFTEDKKVHKRGKYPVTMKLEKKLINRWVLLTGDKLCYARARLEGVPCIFYKDGKGLEFYAGSAVAATSSRPVIDPKVSKITNFFKAFNEVVESIRVVVPPMSRTADVDWPTLSAILQSRYTIKEDTSILNKDAYNRVMQKVSEDPSDISPKFDMQMKNLETIFKEIKSLIIKIQELKFVFDHDTYLTKIISMSATLLKDEDDVLITKLRDHEDELNAIIQYYNEKAEEAVKKETTLPAIPNCLSFAECSLFHQVLSIDSSKMILTSEAMNDDFVKQWHTLNIFSPIIRKGKLHDFLLTSELGTEMRRLLLSDKTRTVDLVFKELKFWLGRSMSRPSRRRFDVGDGVILYNPLECVTYVLCKEIEKGTDEITSLIGKLKDLHNELNELHDKLNLPPPPPSLDEQEPSTPPASEFPHPPLSPTSSVGSTDPAAMSLTSSPYQTGGTFDNPSYFCLNTYFSQSDNYLYSYVSHDDIIELQHAVNLIFDICDVNIRQLVYGELIDGKLIEGQLIGQFDALYNKSLKTTEKNFYDSKVLVYASIKKVLIQLLTQIIFDYGVNDYDQQITLLEREREGEEIKYIKSNDFISEIHQRIAKVELTKDKMLEGDIKKWDSIFTQDTITVYATQDIITNEYLLAKESLEMLHEPEINKRKLALILCTYNVKDDIERVILDDLTPQEMGRREKKRPREAPEQLEASSSIEEIPTIDEEEVMSKRVARGKEFYITEYMLLRRRLDIRNANAYQVMHCINLAINQIVDQTKASVNLKDRKAYYTIVKYCRDHGLLAKPTEVVIPPEPHGGKAKSNKIVKFRLQDYHKKYYPLYYQTYYGNE